MKKYSGLLLKNTFTKGHLSKDYTIIWHGDIPRKGQCCSVKASTGIIWVGEDAACAVQEFPSNKDNVSAKQICPY